MAKAPKPVSAARQARKDRRTGFTRAERLKDRAICDEKAIRNKENAILAQVLAAKLPRRGGLTPQRSVELQQLFKRGKILPVTDLEIAAEKKLREEALEELAQARVRIDAARAEALAFDEETILTRILTLSTKDKNILTEQQDEAPEPPDTTLEEDISAPSPLPSPQFLPCGCSAACKSSLARGMKGSRHACRCGKWRLHETDTMNRVPIAEVLVNPPKPAHY